MSASDQPLALPPQDTDPVPEAAAPAVPPSPQAHCANCGEPLYGKFCYACGQPIHGLVRHFSSVMSDVVDSVFNIDERLFRTLLPLYLRPGRLTLEYFVGRRARYVTPFRLVFFLAIVAFFSIQITVRSSFDRGNTNIRIVAPSGIGITKDGQAPKADGNAVSPETQARWDREIKALHVAWLPGVINDWIHDSVTHARAHIERLRHGTEAQRTDEARQLIIGMFSVAPTVLFVLLPIFALMLKVFFIFKRRLYMEHLIVAMHSHAFLMLSILALVVVGVARAWLVPLAGWLGTPLSLLNAAIWIWMVVYLFLMQKRVYRQGWFMTSVKFACIGVCYSILLVFATTAASLIALAQ
ncbi:MAG TPA: DUF3667 domain-containing protein [Rhodanobacteraceae bacterium]|nr:DUF3667 domain-containing protein [Rhodanobacteraceae bacterium]